MDAEGDRHKCLCGACKVEVRDDEQAIQCEGHCACWFHCACGLGLNLTNAQYRKLSQSKDKWICANCCGDYTLPAFNSVEAIDVFHFDFQQNMPTPKLTVGKQFYLRLLWTYLFGIFCASTDLTCAFMWNELVAHRGANDVLSCLSRFVFNARFGRMGAIDGVYGGQTTAAARTKIITLSGFFKI